MVLVQSILYTASMARSTIVLLFKKYEKKWSEQGFCACVEQRSQPSSIPRINNEEAMSNNLNLGPCPAGINLKTNPIHSKSVTSTRIVKYVNSYLSDSTFTRL